MNKHTQTEHQTPSSSASELKARRRLLKTLAYAPPLILGAMIVNPMNQALAATPPADPPGTNCGGGVLVSCAPEGCCPCITNPASQNCGNRIGKDCKKSGFTCGPCTSALCQGNVECQRDVCKGLLKAGQPACAPCSSSACLSDVRCAGRACREQWKQLATQCTPCDSAVCAADWGCQEDWCKEQAQAVGTFCTPCSCAPCDCGPNNNGANTCGPDGGCGPTGDVNGNCN